MINAPIVHTNANAVAIFIRHVSIDMLSVFEPFSAPVGRVDAAELVEGPPKPSRITLPNPSVDDAVAFVDPLGITLPVPVAVPVLNPMTTTPPLLAYESTSPFTVTL